MIGIQDTPIISYLTRHIIDRGDYESRSNFSRFKKTQNEFFEPWDIKR